MRLRFTALLLGLSLLPACKTAAPRPTGAGSTAVLRLMRDWRGVWSGRVKDSPMGPMPYTLHVVEDNGHVLVNMARVREEGLDTMHQQYELVNFFKGDPEIRYHLAQRNTTQAGELLYREDLSNDDDAVFCPEESCDKVRLTFHKVGDKHLAIETLVNEAAHATMDVSFVTNEIPAESRDEPDRPTASDMKTDDQGGGKKKKKKGAVDEDVILKEHVDEDIGEGGEKKK